MRLSVLLFLVSFRALAQVVIQDASIQNASFLQLPITSVCGDLFCEDFEPNWTNWLKQSSAPYTLTINDGWVGVWTTSSSPASTITNSWDSATSLVGTNSLQMSDPSGDFPTITSPPFSSDQTECWVYIQWLTTQATANAPNAAFGQLQLLDASSNSVCKFYWNAVSAFCYQGTTQSSAGGTSVTSNTTNFIYLHYIAGSGANGTCTVSYDVVDMLHTSGSHFMSVTTGTATTAAHMLRLSPMHGSGSDYWDKDRTFAGATQPPSPPP